MNFHVVALPHTITTQAYSHCAYTQKVRNFCRMMSSLGHGVFHYGAEGSDIEGEHITVITQQEQREWFGEACPDRLPSIKFEVDQPYWKAMNERAAAEITKRERQGDFLCLIGGVCQKPISDLVGPACCITVEYGVGYYGVFSKYKVFESYSHQSCVYGQASKDPNTFFYDCVIPNYYDPDEFPLQQEKGNYLLYLARLVHRKGLGMAVEIARAAKLPLVIAGQGAKEVTQDKLLTEDGQTIALNGRVSYVGSAGPEKRAELLGGARALLQPTIYLEPFGGNVIEANLCGTPAITTNAGAFAETVRHGVTGFRCHTLDQFVWACEAVTRLNPQEIRWTARSNYSLDRVAQMYDEYFQMLSKLWGDGWYSRQKRNELDWLVKL